MDAQEARGATVMRAIRRRITDRANVEALVEEFGGGSIIKAADKLGIPAGTLSAWRKRGRISREGAAIITQARQKLR